MDVGKGVVVFYDEKSNYGFIEPDDGTADVVFAIRPGDDRVQVGDAVIYDLVPRIAVTPRGPEALRVRKAGFAAGALA